MDGFDEKQYVCNQNLLSDFETITFTANTEIEMPYDGILFEGSVIEYDGYVNNVVVMSKHWGNYSSVSSTVSLPFQKGDKIKITNNMTFRVRYYKLRDYSSR